MTGPEAWLSLAAAACVIGTLAAVSTARMALALFLAGMTAACFAVLALLYALQGDWPAAAVNALIAVMWGRLWWRRRKKRPSLRALGEKTRKVFAAMARNMRPEPVLRPAPQGARA
jgi:membrane protein implicated in regulation of membrane protease activity